MVESTPRAASPKIELVVTAALRDLGGFSVRRVLPSMKRRLVGPFIFFDHMGPAEIEKGVGFDVRPHPHIGLATVTYLFEGRMDHRDSLGSFQNIRPGDVNWMTAGRGIVHSERADAEARRDGTRIHGIQSWVALPLEHEETEPSFAHHPSATLPRLTREGAVLDVIAGNAYGATSPVRVLSPTLYVHAQLASGASLPIDDGHEDRGVYVVEGAIDLDGQRFESGSLVVLQQGADVAITTEQGARVMVLGGARLSGTRSVWWNFVSSSKERIERAKADWREQRFPTIPGDDAERIPLPEG
ncbi:MAG: pirin family protein [Deltaproteobacteria bacterium]|nr:pirin family protein [Deltaproteobacteria bacterium]